MKRTIIKIDEDLCFGCGNCVSGCHEGALQLIDGKAVIINDLYCDGLGACIGECPVDAISFEEREAEPYNEIAVMEKLTPKGENVIIAHLKHLKEHNEIEWMNQGLEYIKKNNIDINLGSLGIDNENDKIKQEFAVKPLACGCPGSIAREIKPATNTFIKENNKFQLSELRQFPIQLHLINPEAVFFKEADLLLAADCTAFASGEFHNQFLKGKSLTIGCPKLDSNIDFYVEKLVQMIDNAKINTLTVLIMEVPCCRGLVRIAENAREQAQRNIPIKIVILSVSGEVIEDKWI